MAISGVRNAPVRRKEVSGIKAKKRSSGIERRWMRNNVSLMIGLVVCFVVIFSVSFFFYCYSNLRVGLEEKARTTTDFFSNYLNQSYNEYYQSCITYAKTFEERNNIELQFINAQGRIVASSYGSWTGSSPWSWTTRLKTKKRPS